MPQFSRRFGVFELDGARYELRRNGRVLKLERMPMELLLLLAERDGHVVTRQEIVDRLWGKDVFVDAEHGTNTAIRKIRAALHENGERPRFIQTVLGQGLPLCRRESGREYHGRRRDTGGEATDLPSRAGRARAKSAAALPQAGRLAASAIALLLPAAVLFGSNLGGIRDRVLGRSRLAPIRSIAVLPLANLSGDSSQDYFADGLTDELITSLAKSSSLRVVSRTSVMQYKGVRRPLGDIARALGVDGVLEGSLSRSRNRVHMTVQLIHAASDTHVWAESYDRESR